jgi:hypothetical protein
VDMRRFKTHEMGPRWVTRVVMLGCYDFRDLDLAANGAVWTLRR